MTNAKLVLLEIELFDHLTVDKQMTDTWLNCEWYIALLGTISHCWLMLNWIVRNKTVWSFNCVYLQNVLTNYIFNIYVKNGIWHYMNKNFSYAIKPIQTQPNQTEKTNPNRCQNSKRQFMAKMPFSYIQRKCTEDDIFTKSLEKRNYSMYMEGY